MYYAEVSAKLHFALVDQARGTYYLTPVPKNHLMNHNALSIRPFIGARDFNVSCSFYRDLGFKETVLTPNFSVFKSGNMAFYLQDAYVKDWIDNTQIFMEVDDVESFYDELKALDLPGQYENVRLSPVRNNDWGSECFLHDPSGILWHFGAFKK
jgi:catechol 2,3-dioxygenase-like lactoylglutathione lyase family enzyme